MGTKSVKNVVFDIGNVMVRWAPMEITKLTFGEDRYSDELAASIFQSDIWLDLNKGLLTESEAKQQYQQHLALTELECEKLFYYVKQSQILIYGSVDLLKRVKRAGYQVFALTDNVTEIVAYLQSTYSFWPLFDGSTVSADLGLLKPQPEIYQALVEQQQIKADETVFIDDMPNNVAGAQAQGMFAIQFENSAQCEQELFALGLTF